MHALIQPLITWYFDILNQFGLLGVVVLMAMESSIFPVPSEMVIPPAAVVYLHDAHRDGAVLLVFMVIIAGTVGSLIGASVTYWVSRALGRPLVLKYGKYFFLTEKKLQHADEWMLQYGAGGIFLARLLPVVRHVISIPAGVIGMRFRTFALMTTLGSLIWCTILALFGLLMRNDMLVIIRLKGNLMASPAEKAALAHAMNNLTIATVSLIALALGCYWLLSRRKTTVQAPLPKENQSPNHLV